MTPTFASAAPMCPRPYTVARRWDETHDCFTMELSAPDGEALPFGLGQFNMLYVFGVGEVPISISGSTSEPQKIIHTIRDVGRVTHALRQLAPGDTVGLRGPFGTSWPIDEAENKDLLIVAGGIGIAPLRSVIYHVLAHRERFERVTIAYGCRTNNDILFDRELIEWRGRFDLNVDVTVDRGDARWKGKTGVVTRLLDRAQFDPAQAIAMTCGPEIMMRFVARDLEEQGMGADQIFVTLERNMQCAIAHCGHCQFGRKLICQDGPIYRYDRIRSFFGTREL